jgi:hypothetical protein
MIEVEHAQTLTAKRQGVDSSSLPPHLGSSPFTRTVFDVVARAPTYRKNSNVFCWVAQQVAQHAAGSALHLEALGETRQLWRDLARRDLMMLGQKLSEALANSAFGVSVSKDHEDTHTPALSAG